MRKTHYKRHIEPRLKEAMADSPVVLIQGPRQCGKTTLARTVCEPAGYSYISFDDESARQAAENDPVGFVRGLPEHVVIDEVQKVPRLFSSIKLSVDRNRVPGRFILTGSVSVLHVRQITDSLAGRMRIIGLHPFSQCEIEKTDPAFLDNLFTGNFKISTSETADSRIASRITKGGYPDAVKLPTAPRRMAWYRDYIESLIRHDVPDISGMRSLETLSNLLSLAATQTARLFNVSNLAQSFQFGKVGAVRNCLTVLETTFMVNKLPAWHGNRAKRLVKTPKLHISDTGIACALMNLNCSALSDDKILFGHLLETFVFQELQRQASGHRLRHAFLHYRDKDGAESDMVIERDAASLAGVEVKMSATVNKTDFKGLHRLKKAAGGRFKGGALVYNGEATLPFGDNMYAVPLRTLWEKS